MAETVTLGFVGTGEIERHHLERLWPTESRTVHPALRD